MIEQIKPIPLEIITDIKELRKPNSKIDLYESKTIIEKLEIALSNSKTPGVGLAAPQIGIHKRVAIIRSKEGNIDLVNPKIIEKNYGFTFFEESCLSLPGKTFNTQRYREIFVKDDLHPAGFIAMGLMAVIINHEVDHLDGILSIDRVVGKKKIGRNDPCPCGKMKNGKPVKYKKCHGG